MINKNYFKNFAVITITFILIITCVYFLYLTFSIYKIKDDNYYFFEKDQIPSIYNVLGKRSLYYFKTSSKNNLNERTYKYKNIKDVNSDLTKYIDELKKYNFVNVENSDKNNYKLCSYSTDKDKIIIIDISYDKNSYTIKITKGPGIINIYK